MSQSKRFYRDMTPAKAEEVRRLYFEDKLKQREIAERFGIRQATVSRIVAGLVWSKP